MVLWRRIRGSRVHFHGLRRWGEIWLTLGYIAGGDQGDRGTTNELVRSLLVLRPGHSRQAGQCVTRCKSEVTESKLS